MMDMGFVDDIEAIVAKLPTNRQTLFFSATMPPEITRLTTQFLKDPTRIEVARPASTADTITQYSVPIGSADPKAKRTALRMLIERSDVKNGIVFCNRKSEVDIVAKSLTVHGFDAAPIHGDLDQSTRMKTLAAFRSGELKILVASDVAARGLDIPDVSHVFNYDVPHTADDYVHRIGRTGRAGRSGQAFMIVTPADDRSYDKVLKLIKMTPETLDLQLDVSELKSTPRQKEDRKRTRRDIRPRPVAEHGQTASMQPIQSTAATSDPASANDEQPPLVAVVDQESSKPRRSRGGRGRKSDGVEAASEPADSADAAARPARQQDRAKPKADSEPVRTPGFGDATPAFLLRPALKKEPA